MTIILILIVSFIIYDTYIWNKRLRRTQVTTKCDRCNYQMVRQKTLLGTDIWHCVRCLNHKAMSDYHGEYHKVSVKVEPRDNVFSERYEEVSIIDNVIDLEVWKTKKALEKRMKNKKSL